MKRRLPQARHKQPFWSAPRRAAERRHVIERTLGLLRALRSPVVVLGEDPGVRPLRRDERTQVIWPAPAPDKPLSIHCRAFNLERWIRLLIVKEGSPCCN